MFTFEPFIFQGGCEMTQGGWLCREGVWDAPSCLGTPHPAQPPAPVCRFCWTPPGLSPSRLRCLAGIVLSVLSVLLRREICFFWLWEMPGSQGKVQISPCVWACRWVSWERRCCSNVLLIDAWMLKCTQASAVVETSFPSGEDEKAGFLLIFPKAVCQRRSRLKCDCSKPLRLNWIYTGFCAVIITWFFSPISFSSLHIP